MLSLVESMLEVLSLCDKAGHGEEDANMAERGLSTTSTHSPQAPEIPLGHEPSPTRGIDGATAAPRVVTPPTATSPFEANVAAVNRADKACSAQLAILSINMQLCCSCEAGGNGVCQCPARMPVTEAAADLCE